MDKACGICLLSKLRIIHFLEADFDTGTKLLFEKQMMTHAHNNKKILESQYAGKFVISIEAVIVKRLFYDELRTYKHQGAMISNDACGCFDQMVLSLG